VEGGTQIPTQLLSELVGKPSRSSADDDGDEEETTPPNIPHLRHLVVDCKISVAVASIGFNGTEKHPEKSVTNA